MLPQGHLDVLDLLRDGREHSLLQTVELVKAAPGAHLAETHEDATHGLEKTEVRVFKNQDKEKTIPIEQKCKMRSHHTWKSNVSSQLKTRTKRPS